MISQAWLQRLEGFEKLVVAFSGGLDSTVLLTNLAALPSIRPKLLVCHINHQLSKQALVWQEHCERLCQQLNCEFIAKTADFNRKNNIEAAARAARYKIFAELMDAKTCLILAHHQNDQAETLLLQLFRGTGIDGLGAMLDFTDFAAGKLARPLLTYSRSQLEAYAHQHNLQWIEDESNSDTSFNRNFLRHQVLPLIAEKWPKVTAALARNAAHCQQARSNLSDLALIDYPNLSNCDFLELKSLEHLSKARLTNVLNAWLKFKGVKIRSTNLIKKILTELIAAKDDAKPLIKWQNIEIRRYQGRLFINPILCRPSEKEWSNFPEPCHLADDLVISAELVAEGLKIPPKAKLTIKFRQGGEKIVFKGQTKSLKKLFQEWQIPPWHRDSIPLLYINETLAAVAGFAISDKFYSQEQGYSLINKFYQQLEIF